MHKPKLGDKYICRSTTSNSFTVGVTYELEFFKGKLSFKDDQGYFTPFRRLTSSFKLIPFKYEVHHGEVYPSGKQSPTALYTNTQATTKH